MSEVVVEKFALISGNAYSKVGEVGMRAKLVMGCCVVLRILALL